MDDSKENKTFQCKNIDKSEEIIEKILNMDELSSEDIEIWYKVIDIHKDMIEEDKNIKEMNNMNYRGYGNYGGGYGEGYGENYGRGYGENYGRRGVPGSGRGRYRGEAPLEEMKYQYGNYQASGSYGAKEDSAIKMTEAFKEFGYAISEELEPNEKQMFKKAMQEIMQQLDR